MAFRALPKPIFHGRAALTTVRVAVQANGLCQIRIPREILRAAGLPDYPTAKLDVLIGEGADAGCIALIDGPTYKLQGAGATPKTLTVQPRLGKPEKFPSTDCAHVAGRKQLIVTLPVGFPLRDLTDAAAAQPVTNRQPAQAYAAE